MEFYILDEKGPEIPHPRYFKNLDMARTEFMARCSRYAEQVARIWKDLKPQFKTYSEEKVFKHVMRLAKRVVPSQEKKEFPYRQYIEYFSVDGYTVYIIKENLEEG